MRRSSRAKSRTPIAAPTFADRAPEPLISSFCDYVGIDYPPPPNAMIPLDAAARLCWFKIEALTKTAVQQIFRLTMERDAAIARLNELNRQNASRTNLANPGTQK